MNKWDQRYGETEFVYGIKPNDFLADSYHLLPKNGSVLCLAEGEGRNGVFLANKGFSVTAVDSSTVGLRKAEELAQKNSVTLKTIVADLADYSPPENSFDGVVSIFCHLEPTVRKHLHEKIITSLKPQGVFILEAYTPRQLALGTGGPPIQELLVELDDLREELQPLEFLHSKELKREVVEGKLHTGLGAVAQVIAIKR